MKNSKLVYMKKPIHVTSRGSMDAFFDVAEKLMSSNKTLKDIFTLSVLNSSWQSKKPAIIYEENNKTKKIIYKQYYSLVIKYASSIAKQLQDIQKDSFVALKANNSYKWPLLFWGLVASSYKPLLINSILDNDSTEKLIFEGGVKAILTDNEKAYSVLTININELSLNDERIDCTWSNEVAFCTSGTTGDSRIFVYDGQALCYQIYSAYVMPSITSDIMYDGDIRLIAIVPFAHIFGFVAIFLWYTFFKRTIVFPKSNSPQDLCQAIKKYKCTHIYAVPLFFDTLVKRFNQTTLSLTSKKKQILQQFMDLNNDFITKSEAGIARFDFVRKAIQKKILGPQIVYCIAGGSVLSKETLKTVNGLGYHLYNGYGMTEIGVTSVELSPDVKERNTSSVGKALTNVEYKIVDDELLVKSPFIHLYRLKEGKRIEQDVDKEGYFHTGDLAKINENGYVFIKGKKKEVIIASNGENIYPDEIECKFKNIEGINSLSLLGIKENDEEKLYLFIYLDFKSDIEYIKNSIEEINNSLPLAMRVQNIYISHDPLPINSSLKIKKYALKEDFLKNKDKYTELKKGKLISFDKFDKKDVGETINKLKELFSLEFNKPIDELNLNDNIITDLNGDSFSYMSLLSSVENAFDVTIESEQIGKLNCINDFALYLLNKKK